MNFIEFSEKINKEENRHLSQAEIREVGKLKGYDKIINIEELIHLKNLD